MSPPHDPLKGHSFDTNTAKARVYPVQVLQCLLCEVRIWVFAKDPRPLAAKLPDNLKACSGQQSGRELPSKP